MIHLPIERQRVCELVANHLIQQISDRRLKPGDPLATERELTQTYGVGRSSVREALRILESKGLIRSAGKGTFAVAEYANPLQHSVRLLLTLQEIALPELFEVRKILEVEAAGLAAARRTDDDLAEMARRIEEMVEGLSSQERYIAADLQFHLAIATATRNRIAVHVMQAIREALHRALASIFQIPGSPQQSLAQHKEILRAIAAGNQDEARQRMREHLLRVEGDIRDALDAGA